MRHTPILIAAVLALALTTLAERPVAAKVAPTTLADLTEDAEFVGIVRVEAVGLAIPLLLQARATATVLERWKGPTRRWILFGASPTWACDISHARKSEEAIVFTKGGQLVLAGRGRMPIFTRDGRKLATVWTDVRLPPGLATEKAPEPHSDYIRAVGVDDLRDAVRNH
jgi:hypothetical protein